jgi:hypothetical protein
MFHVKRADESEVNVEGEVREVAEVDEEVLASGRCVVEDAAVDQRGVGCEPPLWTRDADLLAAQGPVEASGEGVDRMTLRHVRGLTRSP